MFDQVLKPAIDAGIVDWRGEIDTIERDRLMAGALTTLMLGGWPEPFGLVAIESMATGTPVIGRRAGGLTEIIEHGVNGFLVDDVQEAEFALSRLPALDRDVISATTRKRFSVERMVEDYEAVYRRLVEAIPAAARRPPMCASSTAERLGQRRDRLPDRRRQAVDAVASVGRVPSRGARWSSTCRARSCSCSSR